MAAMNQFQRHELGRTGEAIANGIVNGKATSHKKPVDIIKRKDKILWEVKTVSANSKNQCIHISYKSLERKLAEAKKRGYQLKLMIIVLYDDGRFDVYTGDIRQYARPHQLDKMELV